MSLARRGVVNACVWASEYALSRTKMFLCPHSSPKLMFTPKQMKVQRSPKWNVTDIQRGQVIVLMTSLEGEFVCKVSYFQLKWKTKLYF